MIRYCARPAICAERLSLLPDGHIAYKLKAPNARGATHRVMTPLELVARVIALIPPPHHHLVRYHGVFAPHHAWRAQIVAMCPACPTEAPNCGAHHVPAQLPLALTAPDATDLASAENPEATQPARPVRWRGWVDWGTLLSKTFGLDVLACPQCGQRMRLLQVVLGAEAIGWWLQRSGCQQDEPP